MAGSKIKTTIVRSGPFFTNQPGKTFRQNARVLMARMAEEGQSDVQVQMRAGEGARAPISAGVQPGRVADHVIGRTKSLREKQWQVTAVVSVNNSGLNAKQGVALMAAASRVERLVHAFRKTTGRLSRSRAINVDELLKGLR